MINLLTKNNVINVITGIKVHTKATIRHGMNVFKMDTNSDPNVEPTYV